MHVWNPAPEAVHQAAVIRVPAQGMPRRQVASDRAIARDAVRALDPRPTCPTTCPSRSTCHSTGAPHPRDRPLRAAAPQTQPSAGIRARTRLGRAWNRATHGMMHPDPAATPVQPQRLLDDVSGSSSSCRC